MPNKRNPISRGETRPVTNTQATAPSLKRTRRTLWVVIILQLNSDYHMGEFFNKAGLHLFWLVSRAVQIDQRFRSVSGPLL